MEFLLNKSPGCDPQPDRRGILRDTIPVLFHEGRGTALRGTRGSGVGVRVTSWCQGNTLQSRGVLTFEVLLSLVQTEHIRVVNRVTIRVSTVKCLSSTYRRTTYRFSCRTFDPFRFQLRTVEVSLIVN